tara:strand:+ start:633 stop:1109 length:477 start_codon:yes stop_codon:yes gene_type:complete
MFGVNFVSTNPTGTITDIGKGTNPYDVNFIDRNYKSYYRNTAGIPSEYDRLDKIHHTSVTNELNNTMNFNATNEGLTYYEEHDTNKHLNYPESRPRFEAVSYRDTEIVDKINSMKVEGRHYENPIEHSQNLKVTNVTPNNSGIIQTIGKKYNSIKRKI